MDSLKIKICAGSAIVLLGCACVTYLVLKRKKRLLDAVDALKYLTIKIVTCEKDCEEVVYELRRRSIDHRALGFDCEWVTSNGRKQPVALLQISSFDGYCGLFRLNCMQTVPKCLKNLLCDEDIYKVGVAPIDDAKYLSQDYDLTLKSALDIRHIAELCGYTTGGLAHFSKIILGIILDKNWRTRCSNWEADKLSEKQIQYAAADAHVAIRIFVHLVEQYAKGGLLSWLNYNENEDVWDNLDNLCWKFADINFRTQQSGKQQKNGFSKKENQLNREAAVLSKRYPNITRSKPLYHNCFLEAPDGELLCTCDNKKALWYVDKQLADVVNEEPLTVRLRFEPAGRSVGDVGRYYQLAKENKCVVCGGTNSYIRKNVVPREYRKHFPEIMKDHSSHDVVLLCTACHQRSNVRDQAVRERLAMLCDAPLACQGAGKNYEDAVCKKIRSASRALLYQSRKHVLPDTRRKELEKILLEYYSDREEVTEELLKEAAVLQVVIENPDFEVHGLKVVEYFLKHEGGLIRLEEVWREHFLDCMRPKYMPELWSVKHNEERLRVKFVEGRLTPEDLKLIGLTKWI